MITAIKNYLDNRARTDELFAAVDECFNTYEQAALAGIEYVLDNLI